MHIICDQAFHMFETFVFVHMCNSVKQVGADAVKQQLKDDRVSVLESFDIKFTDPRSKKRMAVDARIKFEQDRPIIFHAKRNEVKVVVFDVLSLHRYILCTSLIFSVCQIFSTHI